MRHVQVSVKPESRDPVLAVLEDEGIDYVLTEATGDPDYDVTVFFPLPTEAVEPVLDAFQEIGVDETGHSVTLAAETVVSTDFEELQAEYESTEETMAAAELRTEARELLPTEMTFILLSAVSAVVATAGLLLDSPAVVVGSMVIAPLVGPAMSTSVGSVLYDEELFRDGVKHQVAGFALVVTSATLFALVARTVFLVPPTVDIMSIEQISSRMSPDLLTLAVAVGSGIAGARSLSSDIPTALVGVMIAAALVPPAAAIGIGLAWWLPAVVLNAGLVVLVNALSINLAALAMLWHTGYKPADRFHAGLAQSVTRKRLAALVVGMLALTAVLVLFTATAYETAATTQGIQSDVRSVLEDDAYADLTMMRTEVEYDGGPVPVETDPTRVVVTVGRPNGQGYPDLASRIDKQIETGSGASVDVQVRYVDTDSTA